MVTRKFVHIINKNDTTRQLSQMGWTSQFQTQLEGNCNDDFIPARVLGVSKNTFRVRDDKREWFTTEGEISQGRPASYHKMKRELAYLSQRQHKSADRVEKEQWKEVALKIKAIKKRRRNG